MENNVGLVLDNIIGKPGKILVTYLETLSDKSLNIIFSIWKEQILLSMNRIIALPGK